jgi:hypothetical protein
VTAKRQAAERCVLPQRATEFGEALVASELELTSEHAGNGRGEVFILEREVTPRCQRGRAALSSNKTASTKFASFNSTQTFGLSCRV